MTYYLGNKNQYFRLFEYGPFINNICTLTIVPSTDTLARYGLRMAFAIGIIGIFGFVTNTFAASST